MSTRQWTGINAPERDSAYSHGLRTARHWQGRQEQRVYMSHQRFCKVINAPKSTGIPFHSSPIQLLFLQLIPLMRVTRVCSKKQSLLLLFRRAVDFWMLILSMENNSWNPRCQYKLWNSSANLQITREVNLEHKANHLVIQFLHTELVTQLCWSTALRWLFPGM